MKRCLLIVLRRLQLWHLDGSACRWNDQGEVVGSVCLQIGLGTHGATSPSWVGRAADPNPVPTVNISVNSPNQRCTDPLLSLRLHPDCTIIDHATEARHPCGFSHTTLRHLN